MRLVPVRTFRIDAVTGVDMQEVVSLPGTGTDGGTRVHIARFAPGDSLPRHPTPVWQVFAVVQGEGFVAADDDARVPIATGTAAVWSPGEVHTSWATTEMIVVIVQSAHEPTTPERPTNPEQPTIRG